MAVRYRHAQGRLRVETCRRTRALDLRMPDPNTPNVTICSRRAIKRLLAIKSIGQPSTGTGPAQMD